MEDGRDRDEIPAADLLVLLLPERAAAGGEFMLRGGGYVEEVTGNGVFCLRAEDAVQLASGRLSAPIDVTFGKQKAPRGIRA